MPLRHFHAIDFRCLAGAELDVDRHYNLIYGPNASGKTSLLEAIAYLGRGKSFRRASPTELVRHGARQFRLLGRVERGNRLITIGIQNGRDGPEIKVDGDVQDSATALVEALPLQVIDPDVHNLIAGGPEQRRRFLDWLAFHVEQGYPERWRRFRRALRQRNAALRQPAGDAAMAPWDREFLEAALEVDRARTRVLASAQTALRNTAGALLECPVRFEYRQGWSQGRELEECLAAGRDRDRALGASQTGPQRADLQLLLDERRAKKLVSRGQQKLLACGMILAATGVVQQALDRPLLLLLDDPAAELDKASLERLMARVLALGSQIIATALEPGDLKFPDPPSMFHVEQGELARAG